MPEQTMSVKQAAALTGLDPQTIRRKIKDGELEGTKLGNSHNSRFRITTASIEKLMGGKQ